MRRPPVRWYGRYFRDVNGNVVYLTDSGSFQKAWWLRMTLAQWLSGDTRPWIGATSRGLK